MMTNTFTRGREELYASPRIIKEKMSAVVAKMDEVRQMIDARGMLMQMLVSSFSSEPERCADEVRELAACARMGLEGFKSVEMLFDGLIEEWRSFKCARQI